MIVSKRASFRQFSAAVIALPFILLCGAAALVAQQNRDLAGDYVGMLGPLPIRLHVVAAKDGTLTANVDSPDQQLFALPCTDLIINGQAIRFSVPNVHGEWTGVLSSDGTSLKGVWKQGRPMALNLTRSTGSTSAAKSAGPTVARPPASVSRVEGAAACASSFGPTYWDGSAWKPMTAAAHLGADRGVSFRNGLKNPFNPRAGITNIITFKNPSAALSLASSPRFCVSMPLNVDPTVILIGVVDVKKNHRELETCAGPCASRGRTADDWMPEKRVQPVEIKRVSDSAVEITPKTPLKPGQYILGGPATVGFYDFGVSAETANP